MAASSNTKKQMDAVYSQLSGLLSGQAGAPQFFEQGISKALGENMPLLREGSALAEQAYTLPGQLMNQYNQQYGNTFGGASGGQRINSILGRLGNQFSMVDLASGLLKQRQGTMKDIANNLTGQYGLQIDAAQKKYNALLPVWQQQMAAEEAARNRAAMGGGGNNIDWDKFIQQFGTAGTATKSPGISAGTRAPTLSGGTSWNVSSPLNLAKSAIGNIGNSVKSGIGNWLGKGLNSLTSQYLKR